MDIIGSIDNQISLLFKTREEILGNLFFIRNYCLSSGYRLALLKELLESVKTGLNPRKNFKLNTIDSKIPYITIKNISPEGLLVNDYDCITNNALEKINKRAQLKSGDILFTSLIPIGNLYLIHDYYSNYGINESVFSLRAKIKIISSNWLYLILNEEYFKKFTKKEASGSLQKSIKIDDLLNCQVLLPKQEYIKQFSKMIDSLFEKAILIENKLNLLKKAKQFLLPLLLNGQIN